MISIMIFMFFKLILKNPDPRNFYAGDIYKKPFIRYSMYISAFKNTHKQLKDFSYFKVTMAQDFFNIFLFK
jgi:hypothetical protein